MMMNPFKRKPKMVHLNIPNMHISHAVSHTVVRQTERKIDQIVVEVYNNQGERWVLTPFLMDADQTRVQVNGFPLEFLTGREEDRAKQVGKMYLEIKWKDVEIKGW